jgi:charged multivesicular body protein 5
VAAMKAANMELKRTLKKDLDIDAVEDMADDMAELMEDFNGVFLYICVIVECE